MNDKLETRVILTKSEIAPRKMRLVADSIRGTSVDVALNVLSNSPKKCASVMKKLLHSAVANLNRGYINSEKAKEKEKKLDLSLLRIAEIYVNCAGMLKRILPAPRGRAHVKRKRFSHTVLVVRQY
jgi:large subunit ribosomal protein L22